MAATALHIGIGATVMRSRYTLGIAWLCLSHPAVGIGQQPTRTSGDTTLATAIGGDAGEDPVRRNHLHRPEFDLGFTTLHVGAGLLVDFSSYAQDDESRAQITNMEPGVKVRDTRLLFGGRFKTKRQFTWQAGVMYDGKTDSWFVRQTGIMVAVPELWGNVFIGRAKEGVSLNKVMVGYDGWTLERFTFSDAIPLLADGIKWLGYLPNRHFLWNVGWFTDWLSEGQSLLHLRQPVHRPRRVGADGVGQCWDAAPHWYQRSQGEFERGTDAAALASRSLRRSRTSSTPANSLPAQRAWWDWRCITDPAPGCFPRSTTSRQVDARETSDPLFHGGDVSVMWLITGETRSYNTVGGYFRGVFPAKTILERGPGAWEAVLRFSYSDYNDGAIQGGTFWRITPMVNWYLTDNARLEIAYGYGTLDRFDLKGATQFFQSRLQLEF